MRWCRPFVRDGPGPRAVGIPHVRLEVVWVRVEFSLESSAVPSHSGMRHGSEALSQVAVGQQDHGASYFTAICVRLHGGPEAVRRRLCGQHRQGAFAVCGENRLPQIRLLGLGRQAGGGAAALYV